MNIFDRGRKPVFCPSEHFQKEKKNLQLIESRKLTFLSVANVKSSGPVAAAKRGTCKHFHGFFPLAALIPLLPAVTLNKGAGARLTDGDAGQINPP